MEGRQTVTLRFPLHAACYPTNSVKAMKEAQGTDHGQWPGIILYSSTTGLLRGGIAVFMSAGSLMPILHVF